MFFETLIILGIFRYLMKTKKSVNYGLKTVSDRAPSLWVNLHDEYKVRRIKNAEFLFVNYTEHIIKILSMFEMKLLFQL